MNSDALFTTGISKYPYLVADFSAVEGEDERVGFGGEEVEALDQEWVLLKVEEAKWVAKKAELVQQQIMEIVPWGKLAAGFCLATAFHV
ncbi:hypothetical protein V6N12_064700 [Hibiscus sabdariffa]|uniref:Uncharacterized protein n=1 Tax=Hibiscus sabdariffa TaxID=183260 RepID=A0ABR2G6J7_9ROSI